VVRALTFRAVGPGFKSRPWHITDLFLEPIYSPSARSGLENLCLRTNVWVAAAQALVAAITGEANRLLSLDLSSLGDGSQLPGTNSGQGSTIRTKTDITHTDKSSMCGLRLCHICGTTAMTNSV
jgi:hypothetical protein